MEQKTGIGSLYDEFLRGYGAEISLFIETIATLPGGWDLAHAIRLGIKPFAELGANSEALSGSQVDSPCSCRAIFESAPVAMLQSPDTSQSPCSCRAIFESAPVAMLQSPDT